MPPSESRQIPSGDDPGILAHTRWLLSEPSSSMEKAVELRAEGFGHDQRFLIGCDNHAIWKAQTIGNLSRAAFFIDQD